MSIIAQGTRNYAQCGQCGEKIEVKPGYEPVTDLPIRNTKIARINKSKGWKGKKGP